MKDFYIALGLAIFALEVIEMIAQFVAEEYRWLAHGAVLSFGLLLILWGLWGKAQNKREEGTDIPVDVSSVENGITKSKIIIVHEEKETKWQAFVRWFKEN